MGTETKDPPVGKKGSADAPPTPDDKSHATTHVREGKDASDSKVLRDNPSDEGAKLDIALDETFPTSDPPSNTQPGKGKDPAPSSGYDEEAEAARKDR